MISGGFTTIVANAVASGKRTGGDYSWLPLVSPASNVNGIYVEQINMKGSNANSVHLQMHTATPPASDYATGTYILPNADGLFKVQSILPPGQGLYFGYSNSSGDALCVINYRAL